MNEMTKQNESHLRTDRAAPLEERATQQRPDQSGGLSAWLTFGLLSLIWGSSFLWIKLAVQEVGPLTLVAIRLTFGLAALLIAARILRIRLRPSRGTLPSYLLLAVLNTALPFALISWAEIRIDSGVASILNGTVPLFTIVIAHFWLDDERASVRGLLGLLTGFVGVAMLLGGPSTLGDLLAGDLAGRLAVLAAALSYGFGLTFVRKRLRGERPELLGIITVFFAGLILWPAALALEHPLTIPQLPVTWVALIWLGILGTGTAYLLYYRLISAWGSTRTSVITYVMPVVGLTLGVVFLGESVDLGLLLGGALVLGGVIFSNRAPQSHTSLRLSEPVRRFLEMGMHVSGAPTSARIQSVQHQCSADCRC
jgi:drug/metabolite transporter (DMT)-like permease